MTDKLNQIKKLEDEEIIQLVLKTGKTDLLSVLYERYVQKIYYKCISLTKDKVMSKDLSHDILVKVFLNISQFKGNSRFSLWVHTITYNYCMDYLKKQKRLKLEEYEEYKFEHISEEEIDSSTEDLKDIRLGKLQELLGKMKSEDKLVLLMYYQDDFSVKRMAAVLELGESAVKMRLKRARERLAKLYRESER